jgi:hypothetical protein
MTLSHSMLAMEIVAPGGPDVLQACARTRAGAGDMARS